MKVLKDIENKKNNSSINTNYKDIENILDVEKIINLDNIWAKPYFYTNMRIKFSKIIEAISKTSYEELSQNPQKFCDGIVKLKIQRHYNIPKDCIDIVDFIKDLKYSINKNSDVSFIFFAREINEETLFKEEQIKKAIEIIKTNDKKEQYSYIYDEIYDFLDKDFISNKYCDFINNKCVAQRHHTLYPISKKNGCCFMELSKCKHLQNHGVCDVKCLPCRLFSCSYLSKKGVGYWASDFILIKSFFNKQQRKHLVFDFYKDKDVIIEKLLAYSDKK